MARHDHRPPTPPQSPHGAANPAERVGQHPVRRRVGVLIARQDYRAAPTRELVGPRPVGPRTDEPPPVQQDDQWPTPAAASTHNQRASAAAPDGDPLELGCRRRSLLRARPSAAHHDASEHRQHHDQADKRGSTPSPRDHPTWRATPEISASSRHAQTTMQASMHGRTGRCRTARRRHTGRAERERPRTAREPPRAAVRLGRTPAGARRAGRPCA